MIIIGISKTSAKKSLRQVKNSKYLLIIFYK